MEENNNQNELQQNGGTNQQNAGGNQSNNGNNNLNQAYDKIADAAKDGGKTFFSNILNFDVMISTKLIKLLYFLALIGVVISAITTMLSRNPFTGTSNFIWGLLMLIFGPLAVRVWAELMIVLFNINDNLAKIKDYFYNKK
nr:DUF4282 domain-containing protein [uncultured Catonella sp.]